MFFEKFDEARNMLPKENGRN